MISDVDLAIVNGRVIDPTAPDWVVGTHVAIAGNEIVEVGDRSVLERRGARRVIDADGGLVCAGFVDAHVHLSAFLARARPYQPARGPGLFAGARRTAEIIPMIVELCSQPLPAELVATVVRPVFTAMLRAGITGVVDAGSSGLDGLVIAADETGIRAAVGPSLADTWHDRAGAIEQRADTDRVLAKAGAWVSANDRAAAGRFRPLVSAVEPIAASDDLLAGIAALAGDRHPVHVHSHISAASVADHDALRGQSQTDRLAEAGLLHTGCTLMHANCVTEGDAAAFRSGGVTVNWNPLGNALLGFGTSGLGAVDRLRAAGVPMVLGTDAAPSMVATPFDTIHAALIIQRELAASDAALPLEEVVAMTWNGGPSLGQPGRVGRLAPGQLADLVIIDTSGAHHLGDGHPVPTIALRATPDDVRTVIVDGRVVVDDRVVLTVDEPRAIAEARAALDALRGAA